MNFQNGLNNKDKNDFNRVMTDYLLNYTYEFMDDCASYGYLSIVKRLHVNNVFDCKEDVMNWA
jgi:hypothetical protein